MAIYGDLIFYTTRESENPKELILRLGQISGAQYAKSLRYVEDEYRWWDSPKKGGEVIYASETAIIEVVRLPENLAEKVPIQRLPEFYKEGECLSIKFGICPLSDYIHDAIAEGIPEEIRSYFIPGQQGMKAYVGYHDIYGNVTSEFEVEFVARAFCSISFSSYGCPKNLEVFKSMVFALPEFQTLKQKLELVTGPLEECFIWDF